MGLLDLLLLLLSFTSFPCFSSSLNECPKCGNLQVPYPLSTSQKCGNPNYKLQCQNGTLQFPSTNNFLYKVLSIDTNANKLIISPPHIEVGTCKTPDLALGGFKIEEGSPFNISTRNTVLLYNCSEDILLSPLNCSSNSPCREFQEKVEEGRGCRNTLCCSYLKDSSMTAHRIRVRVGGCSAYTCVVNLKEGDDVSAWHYGIELQWLPPN